MSDRDKVAREHVVGPVGEVIGNDGPQANLVEPIVRWFVHRLPVGTELFDEPSPPKPSRERELLDRMADWLAHYGGGNWTGQTDTVEELLDDYSAILAGGNEHG